MCRTLPSEKSSKIVKSSCRAVVGIVAGGGRLDKPMPTGKAGNEYWPRFLLVTKKFFKSHSLRFFDQFCMFFRERLTQTIQKYYFQCHLQGTLSWPERQRRMIIAA